LSKNLIFSIEEAAELCDGAGGPASKDDKVTFQELVKGWVAEWWARGWVVEWCGTPFCSGCL